MQAQESERRDARADARKAMYSTFVGEGDSLIARVGLKTDAVMPAGQNVPTDEQLDEIQDWLATSDAAAPFFRAAAAVELVVENDELKRALQDIKEEGQLNQENWEPVRERFVQAAREAEGLE